MMWMSASGWLLHGIAANFIHCQPNILFHWTDPQLWWMQGGHQSHLSVTNVSKFKFRVYKDMVTIPQSAHYLLIYSKIYFFKRHLWAFISRPIIGLGSEDWNEDIVSFYNYLIKERQWERTAKTMRMLTVVVHSMNQWWIK